MRASLLIATMCGALACKAPATPEVPSVPAAPPVEAAVPPAALVRAGPTEGPIEAVIKTRLDQATADGVRLVVYVGATWCEPCRRFQAALEAGDLATSFAGFRFLKFDKDRDGDRLDAAGYASKYIPLFALPSPDGTSSGEHIEGSINGSGAVGNIVPRLKKLLARLR